jgi:hypothetical protein
VGKIRIDLGSECFVSVKKNKTDASSLCLWEADQGSMYGKLFIESYRLIVIYYKILYVR